VATSVGWAIVLGSVAVSGIAAFLLRRKDSRTPITIVAAAAGAGVAVGGLLVLDDVGVASWITAPIVLAVATPLQVRTLFARGGPFRT
jgi:hypothetical protein